VSYTTETEAEWQVPGPMVGIAWNHLELKLGTRVWPAQGAGGCPIMALLLAGACECYEHDTGDSQVAECFEFQGVPRLGL